MLLCIYIIAHLYNIQIGKHHLKIYMENNQMSNILGHLDVLHVFIPKEIRNDKLSPKAEPMTFIGYDKGSKAYKFMRKDNSIFIGVKAIFNESFFLRSDNDKDKPISPPGINNNWEQEEDSEEGQDDNSTQH